MKVSSVRLTSWKVRNFFWAILFVTFFASASSSLGATPTEEWSRYLSEDLNQAITVSDNGTIYSAGRGGNFDYKLHSIASDGSVNWTFDTSWQVTGTPVVGPDGTVYMGGYIDVGGVREGQLFAITPDGQEVTPFPFTVIGDVTPSPAIGSDGTIYFASSHLSTSVQPAAGVYAINPDGSTQWAYGFQAHPGYPNTPVVGPDGTIYIVFSKGVTIDYLYAFSPNGVLKWVLDQPHDFSTAPAIDSRGILYIGSSTEGLIAINPDGTTRFTVPSVLSASSSYPVPPSPVIGSDRTVYVGSSDGNVYALLDTAILWSYNINSSISGLSIGQSGRIYVTARDQHLYAINFDGTLNWSYDTNNPNDFMTSPVIGQGGIIYVTSPSQSGSHVYAIDSGSSDYLSISSPWPTVGQNNRRTSDVRLFFPTPISPVGNVTVPVGQFVNFTWDKPVGVWDDYRFEIAGNPDFSQSLTEDTSSDSVSKPSTLFEPGFQYFWRVARLPNGNFPAFSNRQSFVYGSPLRHVLLHIPDYEETVNRPALLVYEFPNAVQFAIIVATDAALNNRVAQGVVSTTAVQINNLLSDTTYYWAVEPRDASGQPIGFASHIFKFKTAAE